MTIKPNDNGGALGILLAFLSTLIRFLGLIGLWFWTHVFGRLGLVRRRRW